MPRRICVSSKCEYSASNVEWKLSDGYHSIVATPPYRFSSFDWT